MSSLMQIPFKFAGKLFSSRYTYFAIMYHAQTKMEYIACTYVHECTYMDACLYVPLLDYLCRNSDLLLTIMQVNGTLNFALLLDQIVDYLCATNARGQYCSVAQLDSVTDVCAKSVAFLYIKLKLNICSLTSIPSVVYHCGFLYTVSKYHSKCFMWEHLCCKLTTKLLCFVCIHAVLKA